MSEKVVVAVMEQMAEEDCLVLDERGPLAKMGGEVAGRGRRLAGGGGACFGGWQTDHG
ncbi:MAG: hypothetical protein H7839_17590 [Magnetococcus sp. YQC-5]